MATSEKWTARVVLALMTASQMFTGTATSAQEVAAVNPEGNTTGNATPTTVLNELSIGAGQTHILDVTNSPSISVAGDIHNEGMLYLISTNTTVSTATLNALNILNAPGATISTVLPAGGLPGYESAVSSLNLVVAAVDRVVNAGSITSSGSLTVLAQSVTNALPDGLNAVSPLMQAVHDVNLMTANLTNAGTIHAILGNINIANPSLYTATLAQTLGSTIFSTQISSNALGPAVTINNTGGLLQALGAVNIGGQQLGLDSVISMAGGNILASSLNIDAGHGSITAFLNEVTGPAHLSAGTIQFGTNAPILRLGSIKANGDPTFFNSGSILIDDNIAVGQNLAIIAGATIAFTQPGVTISTQDGGGEGHDVWLIAGAAFTVFGDPLGSPNIPPGTPLVGNQAVTVTGASEFGGNIFANLTEIDTTASQNNRNGGNVNLIAFANGSQTGAIVGIRDISTGGQGTGNDGNVIVIAGGGDNSNQAIVITNIVTDNTNPSGAQTGRPGSVTISAAQPLGAMTFDAQGNAFGSLFADVTPTNFGVAIGTLSSAGGDATIKTGGAVNVTEFIGLFPGDIPGRAGGDVNIDAGFISVHEITVDGANGAQGIDGLDGLPGTPGQAGAPAGNIVLAAADITLDDVFAGGGFGGDGGRGGDAPGGSGGGGGMGGAAGQGGNAGNITININGGLLQITNDLDANGGGGGGGGFGGNGANGSNGGAGGVGGTGGTGGTGASLIINATNGAQVNIAADIKLLGGFGGTGGTGGTGGEGTSAVAFGGTGGSGGTGGQGGNSGNLTINATGGSQVSFAGNTISLVGGTGGSGGVGSEGGDGTFAGGPGGNAGFGANGGWGGYLTVLADTGDIQLVNADLNGGTGGTGNSAGPGGDGGHFGGPGGNAMRAGDGGPGGQLYLQTTTGDMTISGSLALRGGNGGTQGLFVSSGNGGTSNDDGPGGPAGQVMDAGTGAQAGSAVIVSNQGDVEINILRSHGGNGGAQRGIGGQGGEGSSGGAGGNVGNAGEAGRGGEFYILLGTGSLELLNDGLITTTGGIGGLSDATGGDGADAGGSGPGGAGGNVGNAGNAGGGGNVFIQASNFRNDGLVISAGAALPNTGGGNQTSVGGDGGDGGGSGPGGRGGSVGSAGAGGTPALISISLGGTFNSTGGQLVSAPGFGGHVIEAAGGDGGDAGNISGAGGDGGSVGNAGNGASSGVIYLAARDIDSFSPIVAIGASGGGLLARGGDAGEAPGTDRGGNGGSVGSAGSGGSAGLISLVALELDINGDGFVVFGGNGGDNDGIGGAGSDGLLQGGSGGSVGTAGNAGAGGTVQLTSLLSNIGVGFINAFGGQAGRQRGESGNGGIGDTGGMGGDVGGSGNGGSGGIALLQSLGMVNLGSVNASGGAGGGLTGAASGSGGEGLFFSGGNGGSLGPSGAGGSGGVIAISSSTFQIVDDLSVSGGPGGGVEGDAGNGGDGGDFGLGGNGGSFFGAGSGGFGGLIQVFAADGISDLNDFDGLARGGAGGNIMAATAGDGGGGGAGGGYGGSIGPAGNGGFGGSILLLTIENQLEINDVSVDGAAGGFNEGIGGTGGDGFSGGSAGGIGGSVSNSGTGGAGGIVQLASSSGPIMVDEISALGGSGGNLSGLNAGARGGDGGDGGLGGAGGNVGSAGNGGIGGLIGLSTVGSLEVFDDVDISGGDGGVHADVPMGGAGGDGDNFSGGAGGSVGAGGFGGNAGSLHVTAGSASFGSLTARGGGQGTHTGVGGAGGSGGVLGMGGTGGSVGDSGNSGSGGLIAISTNFDIGSESINVSGGLTAETAHTGRGGRGGDSDGTPGGAGGSVGGGGSGGFGGHIGLVSAAGNIAIDGDIIADGADAGDNDGEAGDGGNSISFGGYGGTVGNSGSGGIGGLVFLNAPQGDADIAGDITAVGGDGGNNVGAGGDGAAQNPPPPQFGGNGGNIGSSGNGGNGGLISANTLGGFVTGVVSVIGGLAGNQNAQAGNGGAGTVFNGSNGLIGPAGLDGVNGAANGFASKSDEYEDVEPGVFKYKRRIASIRHLRSVAGQETTQLASLIPAAWVIAAGASPLHSATSVSITMASKGAPARAARASVLAPVAFSQSLAGMTSTASSAPPRVTSQGPTGAFVTESVCTDEVKARLVTAGVRVTDGPGRNSYHLTLGRAIFAPQDHAIEIQTPQGVVHVASGAKAMVAVNETGTAVLCLHDRRAGDVRMKSGMSSLAVRLGSELVVTDRTGNDFAQANPLPSVSVRGVKAHALANGKKAYTGEFSLVSALMNDDVLKGTCRSRNHRKHAEQLLKNACVLTYVTGSRGVYKSQAK